MPLSGTSKLEAINTMLSIIGETPVNSLAGPVVASVKIADNILTEVLREVQGESWHFNTAKEVTLTRDSNNKIPLSASVARVEVDRAYYPDKELVKRGDWLYDTRNQTDVFDADIKHATVTYMLDFDELPEAAKRYVMIRAGRVFNDRMVGDQVKNGFTRIDESKARMDLREYESKTANYGIFDNYSVARALDRKTIWFNGR